MRKAAAYALGEIGDPRAVPALVGGLSDETADVRYNAAIALSGFDSEVARRTIDVNLYGTRDVTDAMTEDNRLLVKRVWNLVLPEAFRPDDLLRGCIEDGGYDNPLLWLSEGWDWLRASGPAHPVYWSREEGGWTEFTLHGVRELDAASPLVHVSYFEADAYARWARVRLPREAEWEHAARQLPDEAWSARANLL